MDEAKRFLRYVLPGLAFVLQMLALYYLENGSDKTKHILKTSNALSAFLASGILGYIASNFYYLVHWKCYFTGRRKLDYKEIVKEIYIPAGNGKTFEELKQREAWAMMNVYWNINGQKRYTNVEPTNARISNVLHSIGTTITIMTIGLIIGLISLCGDRGNLGWFAGINVIFIIILGWNYQIVAGILHNLYLYIFKELALDVRKEKEKNSTIIHD